LDFTYLASSCHGEIANGRLDFTQQPLKKKLPR
jgi:hypothetical protein